MNIQGYLVTSSNSSAKQQASVFVRLSGVVMAQVYSCHSAPLKRIRTYPQCVERVELVQQLQSNAVPQSVIDAILALPHPVSKDK